MTDKNSKEKQLIDSLRKMSKDSPYYREVKTELPLIFWNCHFDGLGTRSENITGSTGFLFFDIDKQVDENILSQNPYVFLFWKSCGGKGFGGILRVDELPSQISKEAYLACMEKAGLSEYIDEVTYNFNRGTYLTYDEKVKTNLKPTCEVINFSELNVLEVPTNTCKKSSKKNRINTTFEYELLETLPKLYFNNKFLKRVEYEEENGQLVWSNGELCKKLDNPIDYHEVNAYSKAEKGTRNVSMFATLSMICYLNSNITPSELMTTAVSINKVKCVEPLDISELEDIAKKAYSSIGTEIEPNKKFHYVFREKLSKKDKLTLIAKYKLLKNINDFHRVLNTWCPSCNYSRELIAEKVGVKPNTISSWKSRFPELYGNADEKIKEIKRKHKEMKTSKDLIRMVSEELNISEKTVENNYNAWVRGVKDRIVVEAPLRICFSSITMYYNYRSKDILGKEKLNNFSFKLQAKLRKKARDVELKLVELGASKNVLTRHSVYREIPPIMYYGLKQGLSIKQIEQIQNDFFEKLNKYDYKRNNKP